MLGFCARPRSPTTWPGFISARSWRNESASCHSCSRHRPVRTKFALRSKALELFGIAKSRFPAHPGSPSMSNMSRGHPDPQRSLGSPLALPVEES